MAHNPNSMKPQHSLRSLLGIAGSSMLSILYVNADTFYWDSNGATGGFGSANGTWGTSAFWSTDSTGGSAGANTTVTGADDVIFGTSTFGYTGGRTVTINATQTANSVTIGSASNAITFSSGTFNLGNANTIITQNSGSNITIGSVIGGGTNGFTKSGSGRLILTGVNTYSGKTVVSEGILRFGSSYNTSWVNDRLPSASNLEISGGIVEAYYYMTRSLGGGSGEIQITGGRSGFTNLQSDASANFITFGTTGTTVTWGDAAFNPSTFVMNDAGASSVMRIANPFDLNGAARTIEVSATGSGAGRGTYGILTGNLSGTGASLVKTGLGTLMLDGSNSYDGGTTINGGGVWFRDTEAMPASGDITVNDGAILSVGVGTGLWTTGTSGVGTIGGLLAGDGGQTASQITYVGKVGVGFNISGTQTYTGDIGNVSGSSSTAIHIGNKDSGSSSDPFAFDGTLTLSGNNSYTGGTFINRGTVVAGSSSALGTVGGITFSGGTLQYTASSAVNDYGSRIGGSTAAMALDTNGQNVKISGIAGTNTGGLTKSGAGTLTFSGTNTYSGLTTLSAGSIAVQDGTLNTSGGAVSLASNTTVSVLGGAGVNSTWNLGNQDLQQSGSGVSNVQVVIDGDGVEGSAVVTNVKLLVWGRTLTNSTLQLTDGGRMEVNGEVRLGNPYYNSAGGANVTIGGGTATSTFSGDGGDDFYIGYGERRGANNNAVTVSSGGVLTNIRDMYVGHVNNAQNAGAPPASANRLTVTGTGSASMRGISVGYAQVGFEANANIVDVSGGGSLSTTGVGYIGRANTSGSQSDSNTMTITGTGSSWDAGNQNVYVGFTNDASAESNNNVLTIGSGASVTKVNNLTVGSGPGTETGNRLVVNGILSSSTVAISTGNTLSGSGTIGGAVTVNGSLNPGSSPGVLTFSDTLGLGPDAITTIEIDGTVRGTGFDGIDVVSQLTYGGAMSLDFGIAFGAGDYAFNLFESGSETGDFKSVSLAGAYAGDLTFDTVDTWSRNDGTNSWTFTQSTGVLGLTVVPEPHAALLGSFGLLFLLRRRR